MARAAWRLIFTAVTLFFVLFFLGGSRSPVSTPYTYPGSRAAAAVKDAAPSDKQEAQKTTPIAATATAAATTAAAEGERHGLLKQEDQPGRVTAGPGSGAATGDEDEEEDTPEPRPHSSPIETGNFGVDETGIQRKAVVLRQTAAEDTQWVRTGLSSGWEVMIYSSEAGVNGTRALGTERGREATAYLRYILDSYADLPDVVVFTHAHRKSWHTDDSWDAPDNLAMLRQLRLQYVREAGYANLRCALVPGCPVWFDNRRPALPGDDHIPYDNALRRAWPHLFPGQPVPTYVSVPCCAQFAVTRQQILERSRDEYLRYWTWLLNTPDDDHMAGTVMEYMWHIIFGRHPEHCPDPWECNCNTYGHDCYDIEDL